MKTRNILLATLLILGLSGILFADVCEQAEREIGRTDELITRAEPIIMDSGNEEAIALFEQGVEFQEQARTLFADGNCPGAIRATNHSRATIMRALAMVGSSGTVPDSLFPGHSISPDRVEAFLNETDGIIADADPTIRESGNAAAIELLDRSIELQTNAWTAFHSGRYDMAFMLSRQARGLVDRALRLVSGPVTPPGPVADSVRVAREIERTDALIEEYRDSITGSGDERAIELFTRATELESDAHDAYDGGFYIRAMRLTTEARELIIRAYRMIVRPGPDVSFVEEALNRTDELITRATPIIDSCSSDESHELLTQAVENQTNARTAYDAGNYADAMRLTNLARSFVLRALRLCGGSGGPITPSDSAMVARELARTDELISTVGPAITASGNPEAIRVFNDGVSHQESAYDHFGAGRYREAMAETQIARQLVTRAAMIAGVPMPGGGYGPGDPTSPGGEGGWGGGH